jgi:hypothetical protein
MVILGIVAIGFGVLMLVARDFFWTLTEMSNSFAGRQSERTELWEAGQMISGLVLIVIGAGVICAGAAEDRAREARRVAPTQTAVAMEAFSGTLDSVFADFIPRWEGSATPHLQTVRPGSIGVQADELTYGRCADGRFFIAVEGYNGRYGEDYLYLTEGEPLTCDNGVLRFYGGSDSNVAWRRVTIVPDFRADIQINATVDALLTGTPDAAATDETPGFSTPGATPAASAAPLPTASPRPRQ